MQSTVVEPEDKTERKQQRERWCVRTDLKAGPEQESRSLWGLFHYLGPKTKDVGFMKELRKLRVSDDERGCQERVYTVGS